MAARESTKNLALVVATTISRDIERIDLSLRRIVDVLKRDDLDALSDDVRHLVLFDNIAEARGLGVIVLADASGENVMDSMAVRPRALNVAHRDYFTEHRKPGAPELFIGQPVVSQLSKDWIIPVSRRVTLADGSFGGVVAGTIQISHLQETLKKLDLGQLGSVKLLRSDGLVLAQQPELAGLIGQKLDNPDLFKFYPAAPAGQYETQARSDGVQRIYAFHAVDAFPLVVAVGIANADVYAAWYAKAWIIGLILATSLAATLILVNALRRELLRRQSAERAASRNERRYRVLAENSADTIVMSGADGRISYVSPAIHDLLGWAPADIEGRYVTEFVHPDHHASLFDAQTDASNAMTMTVQGKNQSGGWVWVELRVRKLPEDIEGASFISNVRDVSRRKKAELALEAVNAQLAAMAATDSLTNLANRRRFDETLDREWRRSQRDGTELALLLIDADHFKALNDHYGHQQGDVYLKSIARIIRDCIRRPGDMAARIGGEEFAVLLPRTGLEGGWVMAEKIRLAIVEAAIPQRIGPDGVLTVSVGVHACMPKEGEQSDGLFKRADAALYAAKRQGRNRSCVFDGQLLAEGEPG